MKDLLSVHVGINTYPLAPLQGCVNDARDWQELLQANGYNTVLLLDQEASKGNILSYLQTAVDMARWGDRIVFTYSGHGSWIPDLDGDELDRRDEVLCAVDYDTGGLISDDELHELFARRRAGVRVSIISDSCHSGTMQRRFPLHNPDQRVARYINPATFLPLPPAYTGLTMRSTPSSKPRPGTVLLSGCAEDEVSYDAWIGDRYRGAFTAAALATYLPGSTMNAWHRRILATLDATSYDQHPQLHATGWQRWWRL